MKRTFFFAALLIGCLFFPVVPTEGAESIPMKGDPRYSYFGAAEFMEREESEFTYADGTIETPGDNYKLLMVDRTLVPGAGIITQNGSTLVPLRIVSERLGADVQWEPSERKVTITKDGRVIECVINSKTAAVGGKKTELAVLPQLFNGSTYVPLRFIGEALGAEVNYHTKETFPEKQGPPLRVDYPFSFPLITVAPVYEGTKQFSKEEALEMAKAALNGGYSYFSASVQKNEWFNGEEYEQPLAAIKNDIDNMFYVCDIGPYWVFQGPYEILFDKYTGDLYFYKATAATYSLDIFNDAQDPDLFMLYYFAG